MMNDSISKKTEYRCFQCGSELIFVSQEIVKPEGSRYPQTNTVYRCSNPACQEKKDKEKAERLELRQNKEVIDKKRIEKIQEMRKLGKNLKMSEN